ncbi:MAG: hypothetical protein IT329_01490 [Caldilineaceae bacterium]|nr:hypothetical protein [Caldilineaceae bacterium]
MKRSWTFGLALALVLALTISIPSFAQDATPDTPATDSAAAEATATPMACPNFVDEDGDGICDHSQDGAGHGAGCHQHGQMGYSHGMGMGMGHSFVDEDGDGVCDNCPAGNSAQGRMGRMGRSWHHGGRGFWFWR